MCQCRLADWYWCGIQHHVSMACVLCLLEEMPNVNENISCETAFLCATYGVDLSHWMENQQVSFAWKIVAGGFAKMTKHFVKINPQSSLVVWNICSKTSCFMETNSVQWNRDGVGRGLILFKRKILFANYIHNTISVLILFIGFSSNGPNSHDALGAQEVTFHMICSW